MIEETVSNVEKAKREWEDYLRIEQKAIRSELDFGFEVLKEAKIISIHWNNEKYSEFVRYSIEHLEYIANEVGYPEYAKKIKDFEKSKIEDPWAIVKPWKEIDPESEWKIFIKLHNPETFVAFVRFLHRLAMEAGSIDKKYGVDLYSEFENKTFAYAESVLMYLPDNLFSSFEEWY